MAAKQICTGWCRTSWRSRKSHSRAVLRGECVAMLLLFASADRSCPAPLPSARSQAASLLLAAPGALGVSLLSHLVMLVCDGGEPFPRYSPHRVASGFLVFTELFNGHDLKKLL